MGSGWWLNNYMMVHMYNKYLACGDNLTCFRVICYGPYYLGLYSLSRQTSYGKISWSRELARFDIIMIVSLWYFICKLRSVQNTVTCYSGQGWFVRNLGWPIGRNSGAPDKSSRGLGSMSRYSAQILTCYIAYICRSFILLCGYDWELCRTVTMHSALCHCPL